MAFWRSMAATAVVLLAAAPAAAQVDWTELGARHVTSRVDRDRIVAADPRVAYGQIALCAERAPVRFGGVVVHYGNGRSENLAVRDVVRSGDCTRLDLHGRDRRIAAVDLSYEAARMGRSPARVRLFAR